MGELGLAVVSISSLTLTEEVLPGGHHRPRSQEGRAGLMKRQDLGSRREFGLGGAYGRSALLTVCGCGAVFLGLNLIL